MIFVQKRNIIFITFFFLCIQCNEIPSETKFNAEKWKAGDWVIKGKMVHNIIDDNLLIGKSRTEVVHMLGGSEDDSVGNLSYPVDIGLKTGPLGIGGVWLFELTVQFDSTDQTVVGARVHH